MVLMEEGGRGGGKVKSLVKMNKTLNNCAEPSLNYFSIKFSDLTVDVDVTLPFLGGTGRGLTKIEFLAPL